VEEFRLNLVDALQNGFVRSPRVTVDIINYRPINVVGEVRNAGQFTYRPGISVQDAIAMAGGYTYRANTRVVYVTRSGSSEPIEVDLKSKDDAQVLPGDNLRVPERYF
jgi:protein involved in polysaccharide export with SLBB domain